MWYKNFSLPVQLTLIRLIGSPFILPFLIVYLLPYNNIWLNGLVTTIFLLFGLTDFFDGYFARKNKEVTVLGGMFDHIADKFLLYSTLVSLVAAHKLYFFWAIVWIGREFFIMALRQIALENSFSITVSSWGKLKTVVQIVCLALVIANPYQVLGVYAPWWNGSELLSLIIATILSVVSAYNYAFVFMRQFRQIQN
jgi:CDP-diacylglycerol--glycerol-3-phosphate 3-phosphatidyltransferase